MKMKDSAAFLGGTLINNNMRQNNIVTDAELLPASISELHIACRAAIDERLLLYQR